MFVSLWRNSKLATNRIGGVYMRGALLMVFSVSLIAGAFAQTGGSSPQTTTVVVSPLQIKNLTSAPVQLVVAPGPGSTIIVSSLVSNLNGSTVAYTDSGGAVLYLRYDVGPSTAGTALAALYNVITDTDSETGVDVPNPVVNPNPSPAANIQNKPIVLVNTGSNNFAGGDGTLTLTVTYQVISQ
jgi:hypothetical protein